MNFHCSTYTNTHIHKPRSALCSPHSVTISPSLQMLMVSSHITLLLSFSLNRKQNWMLCLTEHLFVTLTQLYHRPYSYCVAFQKHIDFPIVADRFGLIVDACVRKETPHPCNHKGESGDAAIVFCHSLSSLMRSLNQEEVRKLKEESQRIGYLLCQIPQLNRFSMLHFHRELLPSTTSHQPYSYRTVCYEARKEARTKQQSRVKRFYSSKV